MLFGDGSIQIDNGDIKGDYGSPPEFSGYTSWIFAPWRLEDMLEEMCPIWAYSGIKQSCDKDQESCCLDYDKATCRSKHAAWRQTAEGRAVCQEWMNVSNGCYDVTTHDFNYCIGWFLHCKPQGEWTVPPTPAMAEFVESALTGCATPDNGLTEARVAHILHGESKLDDMVDPAFSNCSLKATWQDRNCSLKATWQDSGCVTRKMHVLKRCGGILSLDERLTPCATFSTSRL